MRRFQFTIRDVPLIIVIAALAAGWWIDHQRVSRLSRWEYPEQGPLVALLMGMAVLAAIIAACTGNAMRDWIRLRFTLRDLLWFTLVVALLIAWWMDRSRPAHF